MKRLWRKRRRRNRKQPSLSRLENQLLRSMYLCGGVMVRTSKPVEFCEVFLNEFYRDGRFARRFPCLLADLEGIGTQLDCCDSLFTLAVKHNVEGARLLVWRLKDAICFVLLVPNSLVEPTGFDNEEARKIHADLETKLAFLETSSGLEPGKEIAALGLQEFPPHVYGVISRRSSEIEKESNQ